MCNSLPSSQANKQYNELQLLVANKDKELMTLSHASASGLPSQSNLRSLLEQQGSMAGELARRELEVVEMKRMAEDSTNRMRAAEENAAQIAEQLNLIKTTSEEVAMLEAEEIAR